MNNREEKRNERNKDGKHVFLINFSAPMLYNVAINLKKKSINIDYWTGAKKYFDKYSSDKNNFPNTIFHNYHDALQAIPAKGVDVESFPMPGNEIFQSLYECESKTLTMMDRFDHSGMVMEARKRLYHEYVIYWYGVLKTMKPDAIIFSDVPHMSYNLVIYYLAKILNIKTVMYKRALVPDRMIFFDDFEKYTDIEREYEKLYDKHKKLSDLSNEVREYYIAQNNTDREPTPFYRKREYIQKRSRFHKITPPFKNIIKNLKKGTFVRVSYLYIKSLFNKIPITSLDGQKWYNFQLKRNQKRWLRIQKGFHKEFIKYGTNVDYSKKFVYIPLHTQPEVATNPVGGIYQDQILMIEMTAKSLPKDWVIYVKENVIQWKWPRGHLGRYKDFYKKIAEFENVYLIPPETSTFELMDKAEAVATVTGTAGWEAIMRSKPVLVFGYIWYMYCEGVFRIKDYDSCRASLIKVKDGFKPEKQKIINFLATLDIVSVAGYPNGRYGAVSKLTEKENTKQITDNVYKLIMKS